MFCVYLELPYERQLKRIRLDFLQIFFKTISGMALENGGIYCKFSSFYTYCFTDNTMACSFSTARFLSSLAQYISTVKKQINEIRIIIEYFDKSKSKYEIENNFSSYKKMLIPDNGMFASAGVYAELNKYIEFSSLKDTGLYVCNHFIFDDYGLEDTYSGDIASDSLILHKGGNYIWAFYNFMLSNPLSAAAINKLSPNDRKLFYETQTSFKFLQQNRFSTVYPKYFIDAFSIHAGLYLKTLCNAAQKNKTFFIYIDDMDDDKNFSEAEKMLHINKASCIKALPVCKSNLDDIPSDLLEIIYLILFSSKFIFYDERHDFFSLLNKNEAFFDAIYNIMYKYGIILSKSNIYAYKPGILEILEEKICEENKHFVNKQIAEFLWKKYRLGSLYANVELKEIFLSLSYTCSEEFFLTVFFNQNTDAHLLKDGLQEINKFNFAESLTSYKEALQLSAFGNYSEALTFIKSSLSFFQNRKFLSGEYRAFNVLAFLHLAQNKVSDALTYFLYGLEIAEQINHTNFICEALFNIGTVYFLQNNLRQAFSYFNKLAIIISDFFMQRWKIPCLFMQGRSYLEIGEFKKAEAMFTSAEDFASIYFDKWQPVCLIWHARTSTHAGKFVPAQKVFLQYIDCVPDAALFLLESYLLYPEQEVRFENDISSYNNLLDFPHSPFIKADSMEEMKTGFLLAEDLIWFNIYGESACKRMFSVFLYYYKFKQLSKEPEKQLMFLKRLEELASASLLHKDISAPLYLYICSEAHSDFSGQSSPQTTAFLSKAFKAMQRKIISIGENDVRDKFMQQNVWNAKIFKISQEYKLI